MIKQEAIEKIKNIETLSINDTTTNQKVDMVIKNQVLDIISQIDETQKVVVPKFVAEWIEEVKAGEYSLYTAFDLVDGNDKTFNWLFRGHESNQETFARAWVDGYEVEKEKLYTVEIPNPNRTTEPIIYLYRTTEPIIYLSRDEIENIFLNSWFLFPSQNWKNHPHAHLTESEIKKNFEWAWDAGFAKEVE